MNPLDHIASILKSFDIEPKPLDKIVDAYLRRHREISGKDRRAITDAVFGVMRARRSLEAAVKNSGRNSNDRRLIAEIFLSGNMDSNPDAPPAEIYSYPDFLFDMIVRAHGRADAIHLAREMNRPADTILRVNTLKASRDDARRLLADEGIESEITKFSPFGLKLSSRANLGVLDLFKRGLVEIQDEASQLSVIAADPKPGERVLDACAGAGGKSLMMAMLMENRGEIVSSDIEEKKLGELEKRAARAGASIIKTIPAENLMKQDEWRGKFDLVFVDAPCSGTGTLRRNPDLKWRLTPETIAERVKVQRRLISDYSKFVRPGGRLVYATCSILPCENEEVVGEFLKKGDFKVVDVSAALEEKGVASKDVVNRGFLKTNPRIGGLDGFFAACMLHV